MDDRHRFKVRYVAHHYACTGNTYYVRQQLLTGDGEPYWSRPRVITRQTYRKAQKNGQLCEWVDHTNPLADVVDLWKFKLRRLRRYGA